MTSPRRDHPQRPRPSLVVPIVGGVERDIQFSLRLDSLAARIEAAEALVRDLKTEYAALVARQAEFVDDDGFPRDDAEWLGHRYLTQATELLRPRRSED